METIKSGDTAIEFTSTLIKEDSNESWTLAGATVYFVLKNKTESFVFDADIVSETDKTVRYIVDPLEFPTDPGEYAQEWKVVFSDNTILRFPNGTNNLFNIKRNLEQ
jgi:hypothetical protein